MDQRPSLFISYSRSSAGNIARLQRLASSLWVHGVEVRWDEWRDERAEDWNIWVERQVQECRYIIVVCTPEYLSAASQCDPTVGKGVAYEAMLIRNDLNSRSLKTDRYVCVMWAEKDISLKPLFLGSRSHFVIPDALNVADGYFDPHQEGGYQDLYRVLTHQPQYKPPKPVPGETIRLDISKPERILVPPDLSRSPGDLVELPIKSISNWASIAEWLWYSSNGWNQAVMSVDLSSFELQCHPLKALSTREECRAIGAWSDLLIASLSDESFPFWLAAYAMRALGFHKRTVPLGRQFLEFTINQQKKPIGPGIRSILASHFEYSAGSPFSKEPVSFSLLIGNSQNNDPEESLRYLELDPIFPAIYVTGESGLGRFLSALQVMPASIRDRLKVKSVSVELDKSIHQNNSADRRIVESLVHSRLVNESMLHDAMNLIQYVYWAQPLLKSQRANRIAPVSLYLLLGD